MPVTSQHPKYADALPKWQKVRDCVEGEEAVKKRRMLYLPGFQDNNEARYKKYIKRARFLNVTGRTHESLLGAVFRRPPEIKLPTDVEYLRENMDGGGASLIQFSKRMVSEDLIAGRYGLLVDYPSAPSGLTVEQVAALKLQAYVHAYRAESIINWKTTVIMGRQVLSLVVLKEQANVAEDEFQVSTEDRYRVLRLESGIYTQTVYDKQGEIVEGPFQPRKDDGTTWGEIPFLFYGSTDNKPDIDKIPLLDLANTNISWYQVSADHMENLHIHGQVTIGISSSLSVEQFQEANPNGVIVGAMAGHFLGDGGAFTTATAPESSSLSKALEDIKADMINIGGRLIMPRTGNRTAEEARIEASSESSVLETLVGNTSDALTKVIRWVCQFMGAKENEVEVTLNNEFWEMPPDPQLIAALMGLEDRGHMAQTDTRAYLRKTGVIEPDRTDDAIDDDIEQDGGIPKVEA